MKRQLVVAILAVVTIAALLVFAACNPATPKQSASGTDAFASQSAGASHDGQSGGSATQSASQDVYVKVTVKWNYEGAPEDTVVTYKNGELETNWTFFERTGFDLVGFAFDADGKRMLQDEFNEGFDFSTFVPQENYTFYAIWTKQAPADTYVYMTIKWNYEGAPEDTTVTFTNGVASEYTVPQREGYTLKNWMVVSGDGATTMIALDAVPDKDMTVYAVWEKDSVDVTVIVTIKWNYEGAPGDSSMTVENGEFTLPEPPKREGFTFVWYAFDADGKNMVPEDGSAPDRDMTVYAIWEPATPAYVAKDGYYLLGTYGQYSEQWTAVSDDQMIAATEEFAAYAKKTFKAGDTVKVCNVKEDKWLDWEKGDAFTYDNYGNAVVTDGGEYEVYVKDGKAYLVKYVEQPQDTVVTVTIKWNYEGAPEDTTVTFTNGVASEYTVPQREGYTLKNWMVVIGDGTTMTIDLDAVPDRDVTVYAVWEKNDVVVRVTIKWNYEGAPEDTTVTFTNGVASEYTVPQRDSYVLSGYAYDANGRRLVPKDGSVPEADTIYALWEYRVLPNTYYLLGWYGAHSGQDDVWAPRYDDQKMEKTEVFDAYGLYQLAKGDDLKLWHQISADDYEWTIWQADDCFDYSNFGDAMIKVDGWYYVYVYEGKAYITASAPTVVTLTVNHNYQDAPVSKYYFVNGKVSGYAEPEREGYTFTGYAYDADGTEPYPAGQAPTENTTVYAQWKKNYVINENAYYLLGTYGDYENVWTPTADAQMFGSKEGFDAYLNMTFNAGDVVKVFHGKGFIDWLNTGNDFYIDNYGNAVINSAGDYEVFVTEGHAEMSKVVNFTGDADKYYLIGKLGKTEEWNDVSKEHVFGAGDEGNTAILTGVTLSAGDTFKAVKGDGSVWYQWDMKNQDNAAWLEYDKDGNGIVKANGVYNVYLAGNGMLYIAKQPSTVTLTVKWNYVGAPEDTTVTVTDGVASEYTVPKREGFALVGYAFDENGKSMIKEGTLPDEDAIIFAIWQEAYAVDENAFYLLGTYGNHISDWEPVSDDQKMSQKEGYLAVMECVYFMEGDEFKVRQGTTDRWVGFRSGAYNTVENGNCKILLDGYYNVYAVSTTEEGQKVEYAYVERTAFDLDGVGYNFRRIYAVGDTSGIDEMEWDMVQLYYEGQYLVVNDDNIYFVSEFGQTAYVATYTTGVDASVTIFGELDVAGNFKAYNMRPTPLIFGNKYIDMYGDSFANQHDEYKVWVRYATDDCTEMATVVIDWNYENAPEYGSCYFFAGKAESEMTPIEREGYSFAGFAYDKSGKTMYSGGPVFQDTVLYAIWEEEQQAPAWNGVITVDVASWFLSDGAKVYIYVWYAGDNGGENSQFPGVEMTETSGKYYYTTDTSKSVAGVVIARVNPQNGAVWNQTVDITDFTKGYFITVTGDFNNENKLTVVQSEH